MNAMRKEDGTFRTYTEMVAEGIPTKYVGMHDTAGYTTQLIRIPGRAIRLQSILLPPSWQKWRSTRYRKTRVLSMKCVADVGVIGSKLAVDGQAYGGMMHGIGMALSEDYDDLKKHTNLVACGFPYIEDIPDELTVEYVETPRPRGPHGSSGCAEAFQSAPHCAVINAIANACGVRIYELPATPEKIKAALEAKEKGIELKPKKYFLGADLYERIEYIKANPVKPLE